MIIKLSDAIYVDPDAVVAILPYGKIDCKVYLLGGHDFVVGLPAEKVAGTIQQWRARE